MSDILSKEKVSTGSRLNLLQTLGLLIAICASIATIINLAIQIRKTSRPQLEIIMRSVQNLTNLPNIPNLKADYAFDGRPVSDLWQVRLFISNSGNKTIISEGSQKNILKDSVIISVCKGFRLLQLQQDSTDLPNKLEKIDDWHFATTFLQWRPGETVITTLYLERTDINKIRPSFISEERYLIDGDVTFIDECVSSPLVKKPVLDRIPYLYATALRSLSIVVFIGLFLVSILIFILLLEEALGLKFPGFKSRTAKPLFEGENKKRSYIILFSIMLFIIVALLSGIAGLIIL